MLIISQTNYKLHTFLCIVQFYICLVSFAQFNNQVVLNYPSDGAELHTYLPNFSWNSSVTGDFEYTYNIHITRLDSGQSYQDAILFNPPLVYQQNLSTPNFQYPLSAFPLEDSNKYVWQVETAVNGNISSYSEIWMFYYQSKKKQQPENTKVHDHAYPNLQRKLNAAFYIFEKTISFKYNNESGDSVLNMQVYPSGTTENIQGLTPIPETLKPFHNYITIPVSNSFSKSNPYILEVRNSRNELWKMKFVIKK